MSLHTLYPKSINRDCKENKSSYRRNKFGYETEKLGWGAVLGMRISIKESKDTLIGGIGCVE